MGSTTSIMRNDPRIRLAELEALNLAQKIKTEVSGLRKSTDSMIAGIENVLIETVLLRRVRKAVTVADSLKASKTMLGNTRNAYEDGSLETLPSFVPSTFQAGTRQSSAKPNSRRQKTKDGQKRPIILYVAGGGFIVPPSKRQKLMIQNLSEAVNCEVILAKHRLAPEHAFPHAVEDFADQYVSLIGQGYKSEDIFVGADTAGSSVALGANEVLRRLKKPLPAGFILFSPWCDLSLSGWSYITSSITSKSPFRMETAAFCARLYLQGASATDPLASPIFADFLGWPPMLIHTSENDLHFDDAIRMAENGKRHGCDVKLNYWDSPRHHLERLSSNDANRSFALVSEFINRTWKNSRNSD